ncbi:MAG: ribbon-helix-helix domain-containing protein [Armatimonadetes bacterium]|nr:ribbon-helix-helix domain-containing protein [Armatimonadota bacterium]
MRITVRLPPELLHELEVLRKNIRRDNPRMRDVTISDLARAAIQAYIWQWQSLAWLQGNWKIVERKKGNGPGKEKAK